MNDHDTQILNNILQMATTALAAKDREIEQLKAEMGMLKLKHLDACTDLGIEVEEKRKLEEERAIDEMLLKQSETTLNGLVEAHQSLLHKFLQTLRPMQKRINAAIEQDEELWLRPGFPTNDELRAIYDTYDDCIREMSEHVDNLIMDME